MDMELRPRLGTSTNSIMKDSCCRSPLAPSSPPTSVTRDNRIEHSRTATECSHSRHSVNMFPVLISRRSPPGCLPVPRETLLQRPFICSYHPPSMSLVRRLPNAPLDPVPGTTSSR
ncbi:hypothetical protein HRR83_008932 [Exophiala dermatitidis]|nr:hypothetical protein HRR73_008801 [Exophiala dermatitidis]KAJ4504626.1 hypothetical protein HRR74_008892 [Exophiala dermatitidis]KAJ4533504.1 hypothetical protein HRR77_008482 [Exophiala dermatitidis]KAJ4540400.1 hypothetical protein HRR76_003800 [Exophiala dermatitidis]KAJ4559212.1 hypothetical protein HRR79_008450 [Exophiala dermatitidis]